MEEEEDGEQETSVRYFLRKIRNIDTHPDDILDNGMCAKDIAHRYVMLYRTQQQNAIKSQLSVSQAVVPLPPHRKKRVHHDMSSSESK
jgi:hypothetical protein